MFNSPPRYYILPRAFKACKESEVDMSVDILGSKMALPIGVAPTARHSQAHPQGEEATAKGLLFKFHTIIHCTICNTRCSQYIFGMTKL